MAKIVIVLGCHRSGTSMMAGVLSKLGVHMGDDLMLGNMPENPTGYYEDRAFMKINGDIIEAAEGSWHEPPTPERIRDATFRRGFDEKIEKLIIARKDHFIWGWKDPRTVITWPVYQKHLKGHDVKIIVISREAETVIKSLINREKKMDEEAIRVTVDEYHRRIREITSRTIFPVKLMRYEQVTAIPYTSVLEIKTFLGMGANWEKLHLAAAHIKPELNRSPFLNTELGESA